MTQQDDNIIYYRSIEIEVHRVLHLKEDTPKLMERGLTAWISDVSSSLEKWYITTPPNAPIKIVLFRHLMYHYLKAKIYRPNPRIPTRTATDRQMCFDVCQRIIESGHALFEHKALTYSWQTVHILFGAFVILLEACWQYRSQSLIRPSAAHVLSVLIPQCLDFLGEIGKEWSEATLCKMCLHSMLEEVAQSYNRVVVSGDTLTADDATAEKLRNLLFADRLRSDNTLSDEIALELEAQILKHPMYSWDLEDVQWSSWC
ncbi:uncharacterized protein N7483_001978 [Penicillium malachiteum]|uniref:uncharacterized protein n=1 Tax=Penicillium malachiteum TaxID=1324776 RepID=UPI002547BB51|nr:uncharacterized protein N7483_001978 [Penicillium malachiteum]KAJ5736853.1 hypothetical protein N7483_001978 [Penicillium malachiteum]